MRLVSGASTSIPSRDIQRDKWPVNYPLMHSNLLFATGDTDDVYIKRSYVMLCE